MRKEIEWRPVVGYEGMYEVSEIGDVRSLDRLEAQPGKLRHGRTVKGFNRIRAGKVLNKNLSSNGRELVGLYKGGKLRRVGVHILVYEAFVGKIEKGNILHHKDHDRTNNHYSNLQQMDFFEHNNIHKHPAWNKGKPWSKETLSKIHAKRNLFYYSGQKEAHNLREQGYSVREIAKIQGICTRQVYSRISSFERKWNDGKLAEFNDRKVFDVEKALAD